MNMKKIIIYLLFACIGISFTGCYELDLYPADTVSQGTFWQNETHVKQGLTGVYAALRSDEAFGLSFMFDNLGEIGYGYDGQAYSQAILGTYTAREGFVQNKWSQLYEGVQRANGFIANVQNMTTLDEGVKAEYIAEGRFLRAVFYFQLLDFYGGVPYYDETTNVNAEYAEMKKPRSSADEIRGHIIDDLNEAIARLKATNDAADYGRATKGAAYALRGKVYLYNREWTSAISDFEEIVYNKSNNYGYQLHSDYKELFGLYDGNKSNEMIFAIQNKGGAGNPYGMKLCFYLGTRNSFGSCWNNGVPSCDLVDMYEYPDGRAFNWEDIYPGFNSMSMEGRRDLLSVKLNAGGLAIESLLNADTAKILSAYTNRDPRLMATMIVPYSHYAGWISNAPKDMLYVLHHPTGGSPTEANGFMRNNNGSWTTYFWRKFVPESNLGGSITDRAYTPFEYPLIRLGDVLLMLSEAYNEAGQLDKAIVEFNKVRQRESVNMPPLNNGSPWMQVSSKEDMTQRIRKERAIELACEGHRFSDLRRWGIAREVLSERPARSIYGNVQYTHKFGDRDMLWPIPGVEIDRTGIEQNPGW
jgi:hypothetical protein